MAELSANEQDLVSRARALAALRGRQFLEFADCEDPTMALATSMGTAQFLLHEFGRPCRAALAGGGRRWCVSA